MSDDIFLSVLQLIPSVRAIAIESSLRTGVALFSEEDLTPDG